MKYRLFILVLILFNSSFLLATDPHIKHAKKIMQEESEVMVFKFQTKLVALGGGFLKTINYFNYTVEVPRGHFSSLNPTGARYLFDTILSDGINRVNANTKARQYFAHYPMTVNDFNLRMIMPDYDVKSSEANPKLAFIFNLGDKVIYCYRNEVTGKLTPYFREVYNNSLIKKDNSTVPTNTNSLIK